ncbi:hypothetical protein FJZ48_01300, partial [Candidatus Uhrbacteria bacterium]|nr:hypothetical protein [Candidatus Uhrbacteria bacterium]
MPAPKPQKASSIEDLLKQAKAVANSRAPQKKASDQTETVTSNPPGGAGSGLAGSPATSHSSTTTSSDEPSKPAKKAQATTVTEKLQEKMEGIKLRDLEMRAQEEAAKHGMQYIALRGFPIAPEALSLVPKETARQLHTVAFLNASNNIRLGTTNPTDEVRALVKKIADAQHAKTELYFISQDSFAFAFDLYNILPEVKEVIYGYRIEEEALTKYEKE